MVLWRSLIIFVMGLDVEQESPTLVDSVTYVSSWLVGLQHKKITNASWYAGLQPPTKFLFFKPHFLF